MSGDKSSAAGNVSLGTGIHLFYVQREGFGTTYSRLMLARLIWRFVDQYAFRSIAEAPCRGLEVIEGENLVAGACSLAFCMKGCEVTFIDESEDNLNQVRELWKRNGVAQKARFIASGLTSFPIEDGTFDLAWNYLAVPTLPDPERFLREMKRTSKFVLIVCENRNNYGYPIYAIKNFLAKTDGVFGSPKWLSRSNVKRALVSLGMKVVEEGPIDIPPWPGFGALADLLVRLHRPSVQVNGREAEDFGNVTKVVSKYSFIEESRLPLIIKSRLAHSFYVLAKKP